MPAGIGPVLNAPGGDHPNASQDIKQLQTFMIGNNLDTAGNNATHLGLEKVCQALNGRQGEQTDQLWLKRNPLLPAGGDVLGSKLQLNRSITVLDLHGTGLLWCGGRCPVPRLATERDPSTPLPRLERRHRGGSGPRDTTVPEAAIALLEPDRNPWRARS